MFEIFKKFSIILLKTVLETLTRPDGTGYA